MPNVEPITPGGVFASASFVPAVKVGNLLFVSGQAALDPDGKVVGEGDFEAQAEQVFKNIAAAASAVGASLEHVVKTTSFLIDTKDYPAFNRVRQRYFGNHPPASSTVIVAALVMPGLLLEVEAVIALDE